ncbi:MAG: hypothetical protein NC124_06245 [Clostridium sp.]|nr:hypothetical protein [Clostridium sp.]
MIKDDNVPSPVDEYAILSYDEEHDEYMITIPDSVSPDDLPAIPGILARKGIRVIEDKWARRFVKERVVPSDRQNIGMILREAGIPYYSEFPLLVYTNGRCCMDDFYLEEIAEENV